MNEEFIDIKDYEGLYKINKKGEILGVKRNNILKPQLSKDGYFNVRLCKDNKIKGFRVHRLIALHFIDNPNNLLEIDHIDRNRTNNNIENLRWSTHSDNLKNREIKGCIYKVIKKNKEKEHIYYRVAVRSKNKGIFKTQEEAEEFLKKYLEENED